MVVLEQVVRPIMGVAAVVGGGTGKPSSDCCQSQGGMGSYLADTIIGPTTTRLELLDQFLLQNILLEEEAEAGNVPGPSSRSGGTGGGGAGKGNGTAGVDGTANTGGGGGGTVCLCRHCCRWIRRSEYSNIKI